MLNTHFVLAVHLMLVMTRRGETPMTSADAARSVNSNPVFLRRVLQQLAAAGLIKTQPGPGGGSRLARPAAEITLADVYRAVTEEGIFPLHTQAPNPKCPVGACVQESLTPTLTAAESALIAVLESRTLAQEWQNLQSLHAKGDQ